MTDQLNLFDVVWNVQLPEQVTILASGPGVRIERIVSSGHTSDPDFWYDQPQAEWVSVLSGSGVLRFADSETPLTLNPGDHVLIAPHRRHRVEATSPTEPTVWLAVFFET